MSYLLAERDSDLLVDAPPLDMAGEEADDPFASVIGASAPILEAVDMARRVAKRGAANVLLRGETGTGKEVFARAIHYASPCAAAPFVAINCAAIPPALIECELFGYEKGAFTDARNTKEGLIELARDGTLFLDEIASLPMDLQPKLLRALEERRVRRVGGVKEIEIHARVVAAANVSLADMVQEGSFREDLYYRLNVLRVAIPPLRDRPGDVRLLADYFLSEAARAQGLTRGRLSSAAVERLERSSWPGNVRELKNVMERALVMSEGREIAAKHLLLDRRGSNFGEEGAEKGVIRIPSDGRTLRSVEAELVRMTLEMTGWNKSETSRRLGISRPTVDRKILDYELKPATLDEVG